MPQFALFAFTTKITCFPKGLPSVTIHLSHFYAPQLSKHQRLNNSISHYQSLEVPQGQGSCDFLPLAGFPETSGLTL